MPATMPVRQPSINLMERVPKEQESASVQVASAFVLSRNRGGYFFFLILIPLRLVDTTIFLVANIAIRVLLSCVVTSLKKSIPDLRMICVCQKRSYVNTN